MGECAVCRVGVGEEGGDIHFASFLLAISRKFLISVTSEGILSSMESLKER
jgi:hypothetical protein